MRLSNGGDAWIVEGQPMLHTGQNLTGAGPVKFASGRYTDDAGRPVPGAGDGLQRLHEQDADGIDADITETPASALSA